MVQYLIAAIVDVLVGVIALKKGSSRAANALALVAFSIALWSTELFLLSVVGDLRILLPLFHVTRSGMFFIPPAFALLCWCLLGCRSRLFWYVVIAPGLAVAAALSLLNLFVFPTALRPAQGGYLPSIDAIYYAFVGNFVWCLLAAAFYSIVSYRKVTHRERQRIKWLFITMLVALVTGLSSMYLMAFDFYLSKMVGAAANIICILALLYATIQRNLMDIHLALSVGTARALVLALFAWFYFFTTSSIVDDVNSLGGMLMMLVFVVFALECYPVILRWVLPGAKKLVAAEAYDFDDVTTATHKELSSCSNIAELAKALDKLFYHVARVDDYQLFILEEGEGDLTLPSNKSRKAVSISASLIARGAADTQSTLIMADEAKEGLREKMMAAEAGACLLVCRQQDQSRRERQKRLISVVFIGQPTRNAHYRYDDIRLFEWLGEELTQMLDRIRELNDFETELHEAKKRLSLLSMMNHYHHDIKAPFSVIDGIVSEQLYDNEKQRKIILEQVELGSKLITTMAGILKGKRQRKVMPISLRQVLNDCLFIFRQMTANAQLNLDGEMMVLGDADDLKIMFINLIKNAVEAAKPNSKVGLTIKAWRHENRIKVSVADDGVGMQPETIATLWDSPASAKRHGNGIGLQAIKRIADEHHAQVEVVSTWGEGSEFIVSFPRAMQAERFANIA